MNKITIKMLIENLKRLNKLTPKLAKGDEKFAKEYFPYTIEQTINSLIESFVTKEFESGNDKINNEDIVDFQVKDGSITFFCDSRNGDWAESDDVITSISFVEYLKTL